ncbi:MAG: putative quinol monooxygenase [Acidimicrobiales bacterium]
MQLGYRFGLVVRFELLEGHAEAFDALTAETLASVRANEPGTLVYLAHSELDEPDVRVFYELYEDQAAFEVHETSPHVQRFLDQRINHLRGDPAVWRVRPHDGVVRPGADPDGV